VRASIFGLAGLVALGLTSNALAENDDVWAALAEGGKVIIMRHAAAPGPQQGREGDPPGFRLDDCSTQRNLSDYGRRQAAAMGKALRAHHIAIDKVLTSPWCRCRDTAQLMNLGAPIEVSELLHNFGEESVGGGAGATAKAMLDKSKATGEIRRIIREWNGPGNLLMVTHGRTVVSVVWGDGRVSPEQGTLNVLQPLAAGQPSFKRLGSIRGVD
jgi:broad specificity phosphatase PhoE